MKSRWYIARCLVLLAACGSEVVLTNGDPPEDDAPPDPAVTSSAGGGPSTTAPATTSTGGMGGAGGAGAAGGSGGCDASMPLAIAGGASTDIAQDETHIYYLATGHALDRIDKCGGAFEMLATLPGTPSSLVVTGGYVFVSMLDGPSPVVRVPANGGVVEPFAPPNPGQQGNHIETDGTSLFWSEGGFVPQIVKMSVGGGSVSGVVGFIAHHLFAINGTYVYFFTTGNLNRIPKNGGSMESIASVPIEYSVRDIAADTSGAYYIQNFGAQLWHAVSPNPMPTLVASGSMTSLALAPSHLYRAEAQAGTVYRSDKDGNNQVVLASMQSDVNAILVDSSSIFWLAAQQQVFRLDL